jgi:hypothetical protein
MRLLCKPIVPFVKWFLRRWGPPPGIRPPAFVWKELAPITPKEGVTDEEGLAAYRRAMGRLKTETARDLEGIMTPEIWNLYHLRHAEMHLSFIIPGGVEAKSENVIDSSLSGRMALVVINTMNRCMERLHNLLH